MICDTAFSYVIAKQLPDQPHPEMLLGIMVLLFAYTAVMIWIGPNKHENNEQQDIDEPDNGE